MTSGDSAVTLRYVFIYFLHNLLLAFSRPANHTEDLVLRNVGDESTDQNNNITMTSEDLLQPGHVVKERWKVVSFFLLFSCVCSKKFTTFNKTSPLKRYSHVKGENIFLHRHNLPFEAIRTKYNINNKKKTCIFNLYFNLYR